MAEERTVGRAEFAGRVREVDGRLERLEEAVDTRLVRLEMLITDGFRGVHARQDVANGRVAKVEATCAERGRTCPGLTKASTAGILIGPKLAIGLVIGILALALSAVAGPAIVRAFLERAL